MIHNKQYTYSDAPRLLPKMINDRLVIEIKDGLTINRDINVRIKEQDNASNSSKLIGLEDAFFEVDSDDVKLDDKIRYWLYENDERWIKCRFDKHSEWSFYDVSGYDCNEGEEILEDVLVIIAKDIRASKEIAVYELLEKSIVKPAIELRPHQKDVLEEMWEANKKFNILNLAPRFGKTYLVLEYAQRLDELIGNVVLVVASKNLSSNSSFESSFENSHYTFQLESSSLFKKEDDILNILLESIPEHSNIIIVTDEVDLASHSENSISKLDKIQSQFNVKKLILMSGTGIYKARKIIKDVEDNDIYFSDISYTELCKNYPNFVKRNFIDIKIDLEKNEESLNIRESFRDAYHHKNISNYIHNFIENTIYENDNSVLENLGLNDSKCVMVFVNTDTNKHLIKFAKKFQTIYPNFIVDTITSDNDYSNRVAEIKVKKLVKENPNSVKVIFSRQMATRSFSIPEIDRCIIMNDGYISSMVYQAMSRCLTYNTGKEVADIIRVSTGELTLAEDLFLFENEGQDLYSDDIKTKFTDFAINYNSFSSYELENGRLSSKVELGNDMIFIDKIMKFRTSQKFIMTKLYGIGLEYGDLKVEMKGVGKTSNVEKKKILKEVKADKSCDSKEMTKNEQQILEYYLNLVRVIPTYAFINFEITTVEDLLKLNEKDWNENFNISKETFEKNLSKDKFKKQVEYLFDYVNKKSYDELKKDLKEYDLMYNIL